MRREHNQRFTSWQCGRWRQDSPEASGSCCIGNLLAGGVVVTDEVCLGDADRSSHRRRGQIKDVQVDRRWADASQDFERVHSVIKEVPEQFRPGPLFLTRGVPDAGAVLHVVAPIAAGRVWTRFERPRRAALVPEATTDPAPRLAGDLVWVERQT